MNDENLILSAMTPNLVGKKVKYRDKDWDITDLKGGRFFLKNPEVKRTQTIPYLMMQDLIDQGRAKIISSISRVQKIANDILKEAALDIDKEVSKTMLKKLDNELLKKMLLSNQTGIELLDYMKISSNRKTMVDFCRWKIQEHCR
jgi:hypothetical protein